MRIGAVVERDRLFFSPIEILRKIFSPLAVITFFINSFGMSLKQIEPYKFAIMFMILNFRFISGAVGYSLRRG